VATSGSRTARNLRSTDAWEAVATEANPQLANCTLQHGHVAPQVMTELKYNAQTLIKW